ncbi:MAG: glycosyltransferase, partial [Planctomycetota bacterium]
QLINPDGTIQRSCLRFPNLKLAFFFETFIESLFPNNPVLRHYTMQEFDHKQSRDVDQPPSACLLIRRSVVDRLGPFDGKLFLFYGDVDYCKRMWEAGYRIRYLPEARIMHHKGGSARNYRDFGLEWHKNRVYYYRKQFGLAGVMATKSAAILKAMELFAGNLRAGQKLRSEANRKLGETLREVLKA